MNKDQILEAIENMTVLELSELVKAMEEKFGVSAAAPVAVAAVGGAAPAAAGGEEKTEFTVVLASAGDKKINCGESELHLIAAAPACRRQGIASKLLAYWFQTTSSQGVSRLLLEVRAGNAPAIGLYRKYGFIETGRRKNYYPLLEGGYEDAILMEKPC